MYYKFAQSLAAWLLIILLANHANGLASECGIQFCSSCDPIMKSCNICDPPYKPGYANQTVCTRCSMNCAVCQKQGIDSKGRCLSCMPNFNYEADDFCNSFYLWTNVVVIASYVVFIIILIIVFCYMKLKKEQQSNLWFQNLKTRFNKVNTQKVTELQFQNMCEKLIELLRESSSYNNLKFKDRSYEKAMKIKSLKLKPVKNRTHIKQMQIKADDNSPWEGTGYVFMPEGQVCDLKVWFVKNYTKRVYSQDISKLIFYESNYVASNQIRGTWHYLDRPQINGEWKGTRHVAI